VVRVPNLGKLTQDYTDRHRIHLNYLELVAITLDLLQVHKLPEYYCCKIDEIQELVS